VIDLLFTIKYIYGTYVDKKSMNVLDKKQQLYAKSWGFRGVSESLDLGSKLKRILKVD